MIRLGHGQGARHAYVIAAVHPLYHGTSRDLTTVEPADRHGEEQYHTAGRSRLGFRTAAAARGGRIVHDDPNCRVCAQTEPGMVRLGGDVPEPFRNPESGEDRDFAPEPEGGPHGVHWYHGTKGEFHGPLREPARDVMGNSRAGEDWNTELGVHFSSLHRVAKESFADNNGGSPHSRVAHATLHMANPKHFANEDDLTTHAVGWAHGAGHRFLPEDPQAHKAFYHHNMDLVEKADPRGRSYGHILEHMRDSTREKISDLDRHGPQNAHTSARRSWMNHHPERHEIIRGYRDHLREQGHDGITYGNDFEPPIGHTSAIAFPSTPVTIDRWEHTHPSHPEYGKTAVRDGPRCPCGLPVEFDLSDGWQHADGSISHDGELRDKSVSDLMKERHDRTAGKGKPRHAPDVARGADQAGQGSAREVGSDAGRSDDGDKPSAPLRALAEHPKVARDLAKLPRNVQAAYHERVDGLRRGEAHSSTHALNGPLKGWSATNLNFQNRMVHRNVGDELHVLSAGNHDESYNQGIRRSGRYTAPSQRLFGPTYGLDTRLWDGDQLRPTVRVDVVRRFDDFCQRHGYEGWHRWAKIVFFGSEASNWSSPQLKGNGDFDLSIGINYPALKATVPGFAGVADEVIAAGFTEQMHQELNDPEHRFPGVEGVFEQTWFQNRLGWDITRIRPYAAYDVVAGEWIVRPPDLPSWSMKDFPEGPGATQEVRGIIEMAEGILKMPEPYRTQNGAALWEFIHSNRSDAFGPQGEGWWDMRNVIEKAADQRGLMQGLYECHVRAADPANLASPADWSNSPAPAR